MTCDKCMGTFYTRDKDNEDTWVACECLRVKRWNALKFPDEEIVERSFPEGDLLLVGDPISKTKGVMNALIWEQLEKDIDSEFAWSYSGDMASAFLNNESKGSWLKDFEAPDILFIWLVIGEATPKLVGRVVAQVFEFRRNEGLRTVFVSPYGGTKVQRRYVGEEDQALGSILTRVKEVLA